MRMHTCGVGVRQVVVANCLPSSYGVGSKIQLCLLTTTTGRAACGALLFCPLASVVWPRLCRCSMGKSRLRCKLPLTVVSVPPRTMVW
mgnify:CR=1 FL=1